MQLMTQRSEANDFSEHLAPNSFDNDFINSVINCNHAKHGMQKPREMQFFFAVQPQFF